MSARHVHRGGVVVTAIPSARADLRTRMEAAVERLLAALDALDGDPDLEGGFDREAVCEDEGADDEREPEGGW